MWVVLPMASVALLVQAGYLMVLKELPDGAMPASRKRIRTASGWMSMFAIPLSAYGFGFATMDEPRVFVIVWMVVIGLIGGILMLAGLDSINTMRLHRKAKESLDVEYRQSLRLIKEARERDEGHD
tara:strand:+ start:162364 stop:162741 length:378 start_codon:yes stop_codon:yes gene_type:complete